MASSIEDSWRTSVTESPCVAEETCTTTFKPLVGLLILSFNINCKEMYFPAVGSCTSASAITSPTIALKNFNGIRIICLELFMLSGGMAASKGCDFVAIAAKRHRTPAAPAGA